MKISDYKSNASFYQRTVESLETNEQQLSYKYIVNKISDCNYIDIGDNSYLDVHLHELNRQLKQSIKNNDKRTASELAKVFGFITHHYGSKYVDIMRWYYPSYIFALLFAEKNVNVALDEWLDFLADNDWYTNNNDLIISLYATYNSITDQNFIDAKYFSVFAAVDIKKYLTSFGKNHFEDVLAIISDLLNRDYQTSSTNYIYKMYNFEQGIIYVDSHPGQVGAESIFSLSMVTNTRKDEFDEGLFEVAVYVPVYTPGVRDSYVKSIAAEVETILRKETGVEYRWISEAVLHRQISAAFTEMKVEKHASPSFLGR
jgi:hypothetical protein